ncbi:laccase [Piloderma croceum F 1598]|uniref:Laccase n=1 Tax=Piloderma croceum (strain F 1598) TaxID=765440 RepID=A0A0C3EU62_PILCF|nr:laccase [Piloderma croceum F 1598]
MLVFSGLTTLVTFVLIPITFAAKGPVTNLAIVNRIIAPDGFQRSAVLADGKFPGPLIQGNKGDRFQIKVSNRLRDDSMERSTSVHWHGIFQNGTNYNDGTGFVTQCPIVPGNSYQYDFKIPNQAGTFWYHSHVSTQYCDGLRGPLVVYDPQDPHADLYDIDDESTVITLADWYHIPSPLVTPPFISNSALINGLGRYPQGPSSPLSVVHVKPGKRYRFRLVAMSCDSYFTFSIDGHNMTIIEADGVNTQPLLVDSIRIFAGQRYSFVLDTTNKTGNFWIRAEQHAGGDGGPTGFANGINSAILRYTDSPNMDPTTLQTKSVIPLEETNLHPLENPGAPGLPYVGGADVVLNLKLGTKSTSVLKYTMNGAVFIPPSVPVLLQILSGARKAKDLLPKGSVYTLPPNKVIEVSIPAHGAIGGPHPFHLHGHAFDVVRSAGSTTYNYANPVRRDTVNVGGNQAGLGADNVTIRFVTDNTGPWFLHCHIDWHLAAGLAVVFAEDVDNTSLKDPVTPAWNELCPAYNNFTSASQPYSREYDTTCAD